jgi:hypothetical protein
MTSVDEYPQPVDRPWSLQTPPDRLATAGLIDRLKSFLMGREFFATRRHDQQIEPVSLDSANSRPVRLRIGRTAF